MNRKTGGAKLPHFKSTDSFETLTFPLPSQLTVSMSQSMGAPCEPVVKKGDAVTKGVKIGDSSAFVSVPVHAPASGTVKDITDIILTDGKTCKAVVIETDGLDTVCPDIKPPVVTDKKSFLEAVRESGCCGLGGAGFPTHVKLGFDSQKTPVDTLLLNGAECEPYITSDCRELIENGEDVVNGAEYIMKMLSIPRCLICIEENKPQAIKNIKKLTESKKDIGVFALPSIYPQGAEKVLILSAAGRIVEEGELPVNKGVLVMNVSTVGFLHRYFQTGMPLINRRLTFEGDALSEKKGNYFVPIGTAVSDILKFVEAEKAENVIFGGPMMGISIAEVGQSITKMNNALLAFKKAYEQKTSSCIRCGRCIRACPLRLMPISLESAYDRKDIKELLRLKINLCINCGCCTYVCPAGRRLAEKNRLAKELVKK